MNVLSQPVRRGREYYHTAASACRYLGISKSTFFNYRRAGMFDVEAVPMPGGRIKLLYPQSRLNVALRPMELLAALKKTERANKRSCL